MTRTLLSLEPISIDPHNDRIKLFHVTASELENLEGSLGTCNLAGKILAYALPGQDEAWKNLGFRHEGVLRGFFADGTNAHVWAAYPDPERAREEDAFHHAVVVQTARDRARAYNPTLPEGFRCHTATPDHAGEIVALMQSSFPVYPTPITVENVARSMQAELGLWKVIRNRVGNLVAVASADLDSRHRSAELTDCVTREDHRGRGLMVYLLHELTAQLGDNYQLFSLARAGESSINCCFSKLGFDFTGRLVNNCRMPSGWESMNIWCRRRPLNFGVAA